MSEQKVITRPLPTNALANVRGRLVPAADTPLQLCPCNFDAFSDEGRALILACGNPGDIQLNERGYADVKATRWFIFPDSRIDAETGEVSEFARSCFITAEGQIFRTSSEFAVHKLAAAMTMYSEAEWAAGITFRISERVSRLKRTYHDIRISPDHKGAS